MAEDVKKRTLALVAELKEDELAVRIIEAQTGCSRPSPLAADVLAITEPEARDMGQRAARAALEYFAECVANGERPQ